MTHQMSAEPSDLTTGDGLTGLELEERRALRRVAGISTELEDVTEVEYRQLRLERVVLVGVWTEGSVEDAESPTPRPSSGPGKPMRSATS
jgi:GTP-binding protein HflX